MVQGVMRDIRPLPPGWQQHWSQERSQWYYVQMTTVPPRIVSQHPLDLPPVSNPAPPPPPPYPQPQLPSHYPGRAPSVSSMSSGVSSLSSPSISNPHNSAVMSVERMSTSVAGRPTRAQANTQVHNSVTKRNMTMPPNQMPRPQTHLQPAHANALHGLPNGQRPTTPVFNAQMQVNPMVKMPQPLPNGYTNQGGMYKLQYTGPVPGAPQSNPSVLSVSSDSTTMSGTSSIAPLKGKEKKEKRVKKPKDPNKRSLFGTSAMKDLREEYEVAVTAGTMATNTRPVGLPNMAMGGQVQMGVMNTMVPAQVPGFQQNMNLGMQSVVPLNAQMSMQMQQPPPQPGVDLGKFTNVAKNALSGALYLATGISTQDLVNLQSRLKIAFSGIPLGEIGIDARQLEAVLSGQPRANYQGVINALMIQQRREQILMLQTGRATSNVNYEDLIKQVRKMQGVANNKAQQTMAMNAGRQGIQIGGTMGGVQGQATMAQQSAMLQRQILVEQQKLAQMQMTMSQVPMMMNQQQQQQQQMRLQMQTNGVVEPMMRPGPVRRRRPNQQIGHTGAVKQEKKKKPLPVAPEKRRKKKAEQTQATQKVAPLYMESKKRAGRANATAAIQTSQVQPQRVQQRAGAGVRGSRGQRGSQRGANQRRPGRAMQGQRGLVYGQGDVENYDLYLVTAEQEGEDEDGEDGDEADIEVDIDVTVYEEDEEEEDEEEKEDEEEEEDEEDIEVEVDVTVYEEDEGEEYEEEEEEEDIEVEVDVTVYEEEDEEEEDVEVEVDVTVYDACDPSEEYQVYDEVLLVEDQGGDNGGYVYEEVLLVEDQDQASFGDLELDELE